ncbi:MAG: DMSO reductase [Sideroxydans sp.]|nr:DMSO reductase [Sideroxydans sp.]
MRPAFSVIFLTTLIGAAQGLFLVLYATELAHAEVAASFYIIGSAVILLLSGLGLLASFFHLGHPERAWRAAAMWRTSWLSREVIALPAFMAGVFGYACAHWNGSAATAAIGGVTTVLAITLFVCTGMVYAAIKVLKEWASPLTIVNFMLIGCASGATLASAYAVFTAPELTAIYARAAMALTFAALVGRSAALLRNARLKPATTMQSAIGVRHPRIVQRSQGAMGGSFNTREFFHGKSEAFIRSIKPAFLVLAFFAPLLLLFIGISTPTLLLIAFLLQYIGLLAERWFFFAEANHPQNLYYQTIG